MPKEQGSHANTKKINFKEAGDALAKKRGIPEPSLEISEEEAALVRIAVTSMMEDVKSGKTKTHKLEDVLEEEDKRRGLR